MKWKLLLLIVLFAIALPVTAQSKLSSPKWDRVSYFQPKGVLVDGSIGIQNNWCVYLSWGLVNNDAGYKVMMRKPSSHGGGKPTYKSPYAGAIGQRAAQSRWGGSNNWIDATEWSDDANYYGPFHWCGLDGNQTLVVRVKAYDSDGNDGRISKKIKVRLPAIGDFLCSLQHQCIVFESPSSRKRGPADLFQPAND